MKSYQDNVKPLIFYGLSVVLLVIYLFGFFPMQNSYQHQDQGLNPDSGDYVTKGGPYFDKLVLLVIDALRYDFVLPNSKEKYMTFTTSSILNEESCLLRVKAEAPTVTMPRLKAMTSGIIPTYFDVVSNFMSSKMSEDSFLRQGKLNNFRIVFYGDDTWIKLFPDSFIRSEGTNSFFASDFTEVDDNVTRNLNNELKRNDWDFMILHYLGLDHIGHIEGPKSSFVKPKLQEMDSVILEIHRHLQKMVRILINTPLVIGLKTLMSITNFYQEENGLKTLFILTSDHGMKDSGGHGGVTYPETILPLVSVGRVCKNIPGWPEDYVAEQIDIAPTICTAFGFPLPKNNVGKIIPSILSNMDLESLLNAMELNKKSLRQKANKAGISTQLDENGMSETNDARSRIRKYFDELTHLSEIQQKVSDYKYHYLLSSSVLMLIILFISLWNIGGKACPNTPIHHFLIFGTVLHGISFTSTSMIEEEHQLWYFLWTTLVFVGMLKDLNKKKCSLSSFKTAIPWIVLIISHRILRKLNQTGDKWAMLPDIKSYLAGNDSLLAVIYLTALFGLFWCAVSDGCTGSQLFTFICSLILNLSYRLSVSRSNSDILSFYPKSRGKWECVMFWIMTSIFTAQCAWKRNSMHLAWSLVTSILLKPHNVILLPIEIITSRQISKLYEKTDVLWCSITHFWMGYVFYFYQGNSNSIANIDVSAGFVGVEEYNPIYATIMVAAHTNSSHVLSYLLSPKYNESILVLRLYSLTFYCSFLLFQLHHLFIWSVFSPKLLYETNFHIIFFILISLNYSFSNIKIKKN